MPTGYTADVQSGKITTLSEFAMKCARAFGALIELRDAPSDAEISDEIEPSTFHRDMLEETRTEIALFSALSEEDIELHARCVFKKDHEAWLGRKVERLVHRDRYRDMLNKVGQWEAPTPEHWAFRAFMVEQLEKSIEFDCAECDFDKEPVEKAADEWRLEYSSKLARDLVYFEEHWRKDQERAATNTEWLKDLRASLRGLG